LIYRKSGLIGEYRKFGMRDGVFSNSNCLRNIDEVWWLEGFISVPNV